MLKGIGIVAFLLVALPVRPQDAPPKVDFVRDVLPVFEASCHKCHGPEGKPKGQFRIDGKAFALKGGVTGGAIVPGKPEESLVYKLLVETDEDSRMPQKAPPLEKEKIELVRRWIAEGAAWPESASGSTAVRKHWAYVKPARPRLPPVKNAAWCRNEIDRFVLARLEKEGLAPAPEATKETLVRRLHLDLVGLPPEVDEVDRFVSDASPDAYVKLVDRLFASPHYGERWARPWLDLARYADTNGFNFDSRRTMWRYRDWVIRALNEDMPYDRFTVEQLGGDLLPGATLEQRVATGFHRNTMTNEEGGVDKEEARWETLLDRVNTTGAVWLGATLACAQCHNHKYDPFTQKEYYQFLAFFDNQEEPRIELLTPEQIAERRALRAKIAVEEKALGQVDGLELPGHVKKALTVAFEKRGNTQRNDVAVYCRSQMPRSQEMGAKLLALYQAHEKLEAATALVLQERPSKEPPSTPFRIKGGFTNVGKQVTAGVPASLHPWRPEYPRNRLGLAVWLVDPESPLVARVAVNRFWDVFFGRPLLETPEDFGTQSQPPAHPELLDWLATEFVRAGWRMKAIHRTIVLSATYRQSSRVDAALAERDPYNRLLARGPRFRMEAEMVRDAVLAASGLLSRRVGGPSVFPLQADTSGVVAINKVDTGWAASEGGDRYRRGLYTHWRRTAPFAAFATFDAPSRECCTIRRPRTNTPLQALAGLNDPAFFDAAKGLARRLMAEGPGNLRGKAEFGFRLCVARRPHAEELEILVRAFEKEFGRRKDAAAAWTMVANVLLNLDETLTKE